MSTRTHNLLRRALPQLPALAAALVLAVLIPLACIAHCLLISPSGATQSSAAHNGHDHSGHSADRHGATPADDSFTPHGHDHRLCGMHEGEGAAGTLYPRSLYDMVPLAVAVVVLALAGPGLAAVWPDPRPLSPAFAPLTPPPRPLA